jgi:hypothetical protein
MLGARAAYPYALYKEPKLDTYGGMMLGFTIANARFYSNDPSLNQAPGGDNSMDGNTGIITIRNVNRSTKKVRSAGTYAP